MRGLKAWCVRCGRGPDQIEISLDIARDARRFTIRCHGATETGVLDHQTMIDANAIVIRAFDHPALPERAATTN